MNGKPAREKHPREEMGEKEPRCMGSWGKEEVT